MTRTVKFDGRPIWAEVSLGALTHNLRAIRAHVNPAGTRGPRRKILAVIKSNAYGHGIVPVARALSKVRADWFGVTCSAEGAELRESGIREPVLILTGFWAGEEKRILDNHLTPAIMSADQLRLLEKAAAQQRKPRKRPFDFHLKIDTGMNRLGIPPSEVPAFARALADCRHLRLAGTFTHIASSEVFTTEQTIEQEKTFDAALACMRSLGLDPGIVHMANSAAIVSRPSTWRDMVRPGAILYGYHQFFEPSELNPEMEAKLPVRPGAFVPRADCFDQGFAAGIARRIQRAVDGVGALSRRRARRGIRGWPRARAFQQGPRDRSRRDRSHHRHGFDGPHHRRRHGNCIGARGRYRHDLRHRRRHDAIRPRRREDCQHRQRGPALRARKARPPLLLALTLRSNSH